MAPYQERITEVKGNLILRIRNKSHLGKNPMFGSCLHKKKELSNMLRITQLVNNKRDLRPKGLTLVPDSLTIKLDSKSLLEAFHGTLGSFLLYTFHTLFTYLSFSLKGKLSKTGCFIFLSDQIMSNFFLTHSFLRLGSSGSLATNQRF